MVCQPFGLEMIHRNLGDGEAAEEFVEVVEAVVKQLLSLFSLLWQFFYLKISNRKLS